MNSLRHGLGSLDMLDASGDSTPRTSSGSGTPPWGSADRSSTGSLMSDATAFQASSHVHPCRPLAQARDPCNDSSSGGGALPLGSAGQLPTVSTPQHTISPLSLTVQVTLILLYRCCLVLAIHSGFGNLVWAPLHYTQPFAVICVRVMRALNPLHLKTSYCDIRVP